MKNTSQPHQHPAFWKSKAGVACLVLSVVALFYLLSEHREHFFNAAPYLIFLLCPAMHLFMHHGHHHDSNRNQPDSNKEN